MSEEITKRKTHTSSEVKRRYNEKTYTQIIVSVKKETAVKYKEKCKELGVSYSQPLHDAIEKLLENK